MCPDFTLPGQLSDDKRSAPDDAFVFVLQPSTHYLENSYPEILRCKQVLMWVDCWGPLGFETGHSYLYQWWMMSTENSRFFALLQSSHEQIHVLLYNSTYLLRRTILDVRDLKIKHSWKRLDMDVG